MDLPHLMETGTSTFRRLTDRLDTAAILYTGGTTGVPKAAMPSHEGMNFAARAIAYIMSIRCLPTRPSVFFRLIMFSGKNHIMNSTVYSSGCLELPPLLIWIARRQSPQESHEILCCTNCLRPLSQPARLREESRKALVLFFSSSKHGERNSKTAERANRERIKLQSLMA